MQELKAFVFSITSVKILVLTLFSSTSETFILKILHSELFLCVNTGCQEGWYSFYWSISLHRKWNNIFVAWGVQICISLTSYHFSVHLLMCCNLQVVETSGENVECLVTNTATLAGPMFTLHVSKAHVSLPTLSDYDKEVRGLLGLFMLQKINLNFLACYMWLTEYFCIETSLAIGSRIC